MKKTFEQMIKLNRTKLTSSSKLFVVFMSAALLSIMPTFSIADANAAQAKPICQTFHLPDTPYLPPYTGRIVKGDFSSQPQPDGGIAYLITFEAQEQPEQVLSWYKSAFQLYQWNIDKNQSAQYRLTAQRKNIESNLFLLSPRQADSRVQVQLYYRYVGRDI